MSTTPRDTNPPGSPVHGTSTITAVGKKGVPWWMWVIPLLLLLGVLLVAMRSCGRHDKAVTTIDAAPAATGATTAPVGVKKVTLPGGTTLELESSSLNYLLQDYLASSAPAPRTFTFDRLNFATASAELPADAQSTVDALAQILKAYPASKVQLAGYADARGTEASNAQLGAQRAQAVAAALISRGITAERVSTASGGESNPVDTNATSQGRAENRRTELVVTTK